MKMKDKIIYLVIGALIGAILTAGGFLIFGKNNNGMPNDMGDRSQMREMDGNMTRPDNADGNMVRTDKSGNTIGSDETTITN